MQADFLGVAILRQCQSPPTNRIDPKLTLRISYSQTPSANLQTTDDILVGLERGMTTTQKLTQTTLCAMSDRRLWVVMKWKNAVAKWKAGARHVYKLLLKLAQQAQLFGCWRSRTRNVFGEICAFPTNGEETMSERSITQFFSALGAPLCMLRQSWEQREQMAVFCVLPD